MNNVWKPTKAGTFLLDGRVSFTYEENGLILTVVASPFSLVCGRCFVPTSSPGRCGCRGR